MIHSTPRLVRFALLTLTLTVGCYGAPPDEEAVVSPLFEATCATASLNLARGQTVSTLGGFAVMGPEPACGYDSRTVTSPNTSYGQASCPGQFIAEIRGVTGRSYEWFVTAADAPSTRTACEATTLSAAAYGRLAGTWSKLGSRFFQGAWSTFGGGGAGWCVFNPIGGSLPGTAAHDYDVVRLAVAGFRSGTPVRIKAGVSYGRGPC